MTIDKYIHDQLVDLVEDSVEYFCNEYMVSGEMAYLIVETLAEAKLAQFKGSSGVGSADLFGGSHANSSQASSIDVDSIK